MEKKALIEKLRNCRSAVDFYDMKEEILSLIEGKSKK